MVDRFASGPFRVVRVGVAGMAFAAASYWIGTHTGGLPGFGATVASLAVVAVTLGVVAALIVDDLTGEKQTGTRTAERPSPAPREAPLPRGRCGICNQQRARFGSTLVCSNCDQQPT